MAGSPKRSITISTLRDAPLFTTAQAREAGISGHDLAVLVRRRLVWRAAPRWYSCRPDATEDERHILRAIATLRLHGDHAVACRVSAVLLHGMPVARCDLSTVEIATVGAGHGRTRRGVRVSEFAAKGVECVDVDVPLVGASVRVVDPATAIVGTAASNNPLAAVVAGDHAPESPGETLTAAILRQGPWDFDPQVWVTVRGRRYRLDFALREYRVAIEFDGQVKYTGPEVMEAQLAREADLVAEGWVVVRCTWEDLDDADALITRVREAVIRARAAA